MSNLRAKVRSGDYKDTVLYPHKHEDDKYVATNSKFEEDYIRVDTTEELESLVESGYGARMSNPDIPNAPSYITKGSLYFDESAPGKPSPPSKFLTKATGKEDFDKNSFVKVRKEQAFLRAHLLQGRSEAICTICGEEFPFDLLVAAHIKKRSACKPEEKCDFDNVAALMCKTGCDDFYEKGYIVVKDGLVELGKRKVKSPKLTELLNRLAGKTVKKWSGSEKYYKWHFDAFGKKPVKSAVKI